MLDTIKKADLLRPQKSMETSLGFNIKATNTYQASTEISVGWQSKSTGKRNWKTIQKMKIKLQSVGEVVQEETPGGYYRREVSFGSGYIVFSYC